MSSEKSSVWKLVEYKTSVAIAKIGTNRYFKSNLVYLMYATIMIIMDVYDFPADMEGAVYFFLAIAHAINAYMYLWVWRGEHQNIYSYFCIPDWLNVVCAAFYLGTGFCAPYEYDADGEITDIFVQVRRIELFLSVLEVIATVGWLLQWYIEFRKDLVCRPQLCKGRGFTLDDPDCWANISLVIAAGYYFVYNIVIYKDYAFFESSTLYYQGDLWYLANAVCYVICSLRDCDFFWFMPLAGHFPDFEQMANELELEKQLAGELARNNAAFAVQSPLPGLVPRSKSSDTTINIAPLELEPSDADDAPLILKQEKHK
jgi:hypothetical protein